MTKEFMEKARQAKSAEELLALAKESGIEMDQAQAKEMLEKPAELTDEELDEVAGGARDWTVTCPECGWTAVRSGYITDQFTCGQCLGEGKLVYCKKSVIW